MSRPLQKDKTSTLLRTAVVKQVTGDTYFVADGASLSRTERAAGCLLEPQLDDLVLLSINSMGTSYILTVLERQGNDPAIVSVEGDLVIHSERGNLSLQGSQSLNLVSSEIHLSAASARMQFADFAFAGTLVTGCARHLRMVCETVESKATRVVERVNRLYRRVGDEDSRLGRFRCRVRGRFSVRAEDASIDAEKRMRLNGDKIELG